MNALRECFNNIVHNLPSKHQYTEANYQNALCWMLSQYGTVQKEVTINYSFDAQTPGEGKDLMPVVFGSGRIDVLFRPYNSDTTFLLELKISPKPYRINNYFPQVHRYLHHFRRASDEKVRGVLICFSAYGSQCVSVPEEL